MTNPAMNSRTKKPIPRSQRSLPSRAVVTLLRYPITPVRAVEISEIAEDMVPVSPDAETLIVKQRIVITARDSIISRLRIEVFLTIFCYLLNIDLKTCIIIRIDVIPNIRAPVTMISSYDVLPNVIPIICSTISIMTYYLKNSV